MRVPAIAVGHIMQIEPVEFFSEGVRLAGDLYLPDRSSGPAPAVLLCHGYTGLKHLYMPEVARRLVDAGYAAFAFDYKGWGASEGPPLRLAPYGRVADADAALTYLVSRREIDAGRIGAFGWSYGAATAIWLAAHDWRVKAVAGVVGVASGRRWLKDVRSEAEWQELLGRSEEDHRRHVLTGKTRMVERAYVLHMDTASVARSAEQRKSAGIAADEVPMEFIEQTLKFNPEWVVAHLAPRPLLLIACDQDKVVPPDESIRLYDAARQPKELVVLKGYDHYDVYAGPAFEATMEAALKCFDNAFG